MRREAAAPEVIAGRALTGSRGTSAPKDQVHAGCEGSAAQERHERDPAEILPLRQLRQLTHDEFKIVARRKRPFQSSAAPRGAGVSLSGVTLTAVDPLTA
jgi:hypothetical protein